MTEFAVRAAAFERDEEVNTEYVVLAEELDGSGRRLEIQRSITPDPQDAELGMDTYCLVNEAGAVHYGGVAEWALRDDSLVEIALTPEADEALEADGGYRLRLQGPDAATVRTGLQTILA